MHDFHSRMILFSLDYHCPLFLHVSIMKGGVGIVVQQVKPPPKLSHPVSEGWFKSWIFCFLSSFLLMHPGRQQVMGQVPGSLSLTWETLMEFCLPGLGLASPCVLKCPSRWKICLLFITLPADEKQLFFKFHNNLV